MPIHTKGQLVIGGSGVTNGYFENVKKTDSSFVNTNFYNKKVYLTGDLCIINHDHEIEILNRIDNQIKINGQRIEIEEIESLILKNRAIKDVAISYRNGKHLVCFYSLKESNGDIDLNRVKKQLMNKLPLYMVPNFFIKLQSIPYTLNNKKDRKKIGMIDIKDYICNSDEKIILPKNELQKDLYDSILKITEYDKLSIDTNIEELNIDSLDGIKIQIDLLKKGIILNYTELIRYKNIIGIYEHLANDKIKNSDKNYSKLNDEYVDILNNTLSLKQKPEKIKNVILTGLTGFLGVHILSELIEGKKAEKIYCIVRKKGNTSIKNRVIDLFNYYFDGKYIDQIDKKIILIDVDLLDKNFEIVLQNKTTNVNYFIHAAACVKHYGDDNYFKLINVDVTENIAKFCLKHDINLIHSSTLSISGNGFDIGINNKLIDAKVFDETSLYIGQNLDNVYAKTKFEAECVILKYIKKGLRANIIRYGNLTSRKEDLKFQKNVSDNAFVSRIRLLALLKLVPKSQENIYLEFTPIDEAASATNIIFENFIPNKIYHIYNNNHVALEEFIKILNKEFKFGINIVKDAEFSSSLKNIMDVYDDDIKSIVVQDIDENYMVNYKSNVGVKCNFTLKFLDKYKFKWKKIDEDYLINYIKYFIKNGYIC